jgi:hypothetical protein
MVVLIGQMGCFQIRKGQGKLVFGDIGLASEVQSVGVLGFNLYNKATQLDRLVVLRDPDIAGRAPQVAISHDLEGFRVVLLELRHQILNVEHRNSLVQQGKGVEIVSALIQGVPLTLEVLGFLYLSF